MTDDWRRTTNNGRRTTHFKSLLLYEYSIVLYFFRSITNSTHNSDFQFLHTHTTKRWHCTIDLAIYFPWIATKATIPEKLAINQVGWSNFEYVCNDIDESARPKSKSSKAKELVPPFVDLMLSHLQKEETNIPALLRANFTQEEDDACMHTILKNEGISGLGMSCWFSWLCRNGPRRSSSTSSFAASAHHFICWIGIIICPITKRASARWEMPRCWSASLDWVRQNAARSLSASRAFSRRRWQSGVSGDYWKVFQ